MNTRKPVTLHRLREMHASDEKIAMLTCYDASFARVLDEAGVDVLLVGDSLGMVLQGHSTTLPVSMDEMIYHTRCVASGNSAAWIMADMPFASYQESPQQAWREAARLVQVGAHMVKLEADSWSVPVLNFLAERGIPVCAHIGFTPQSVHALGGYRIQGREAKAVHKLHSLADELVAAGAQMLLIELVPALVARDLTLRLKVPVIGIGAGRDCSGQVLVLYDLLGITAKVPRFVRNFMDGNVSIAAAVGEFVTEVKAGRFPDNTLHGY